jgi:Uma2 family endonuclease
MSTAARSITDHGSEFVGLRMTTEEFFALSDDGYDYERYGAFEYWLIDAQRETMIFLRLAEGRYVEVALAGDTFHSEAVPGFVLDLRAVRTAGQPI